MTWTPELIIAIILAGNSILSTVSGAIVAIVVALISNRDKAKREISDFELNRKDKEWFDDIFDGGELHEYTRASQKRIRRHYKKLIKQLEKSTAFAAEEFARAEAEKLLHEKICAQAAGPDIFKKDKDDDNDFDVDVEDLF